MTDAPPRIIAVAQDGGHGFSKRLTTSLQMLEGLGVAGDAHAGSTVQHRSRVAVDPTQPNLRQVHLLHAELLDHLVDRGFLVQPGDLGENLTTRGIDLLGLPTDTRLAIGPTAVLRMTGLRNPCVQIERFMSGLLAKVVERRADGTVVRKCGVMAVVEGGGTIAPGDAIAITLPPPPHRPLEPV